MFQYIDDDYKHLLCIITQGVVNGEKLSGTAHVGEHMCLLPCSEEVDSKCGILYTSGYTCIDHACLYYVSEDVDNLYAVIDKLSDKSIVRQDRVDVAKHQVTQELRNLGNQFAINEKVVRFVTDHRICHFASGTIEDVQQITIDDMSEWLNEIHTSGKFLTFMLESHNYCLSDNLFNEIGKKEKVIIDENYREEMLHINNGPKEMAFIYIKKPCTYDKAGYFRETVEENYLQYFLKVILKKEVKVYNKFFSYEERYLVIETEKSSYKNCIELLRNINILHNRTEYLKFKKLFYETHKQKKGMVRNSNIDIITKIQNSILYNLPFLEVSEDLGLINVIGEELSNDINSLLKQKFKVIIFDSEDSNDVK